MTTDALSENECEMEDHDPRTLRLAVLVIPDDNGKPHRICDACLKSVFDSVFQPKAPQ